MGLTHVAVKVRNRDSNQTLTAKCLVDTGATDSLIPAGELKRIGIAPVGKKTYELANGELEQFEVSYAELTFLGESIVSRVIFGPDNAEPILGVIALESMGVIVDPVNQTLKKVPALPLK